jgi:hypothetical protein
MDPSDLSTLRAALLRLARETRLPAGLVETALECGLIVEDDPPEAQLRSLRRMRRLMQDLGVNAPGAALLVRMRRDVMALRREVRRLQRLEAEYFDDWRDAVWRELDE